MTIVSKLNDAISILEMHVQKLEAAAPAEQGIRNWRR
jgi:hypothetical protein